MANELTTAEMSSPKVSGDKENVQSQNNPSNPGKYYFRCEKCPFDAQHIYNLRD